MKTLTKIIISVIISILIISTVFYEITEIPKTETKKLEYLPIKYEFRIYVNAYNSTVYEAIVHNNYTFPITIYERFNYNNSIYYQRLQVFLDCNTYAYLEEPHDATYTLDPVNYYPTYVILNAQNFNDSTFCLYGVPVGTHYITPTPTQKSVTSVNVTLDTQIDFETLNARTTRAVISEIDYSKNTEILSTIRNATVECYILLNNGTTIQIKSTFDVLLNNNGRTLEKNGLSGIQPTISNYYDSLTGPFYSYWVWSSDTPENTFLNSYTFLTESGSNIVVPTPINAYINITTSEITP